MRLALRQRGRGKRADAAGKTVRDAFAIVMIRMRHRCRRRRCVVSLSSLGGLFEEHVKSGRGSRDLKTAEESGGTEIL